MNNCKLFILWKKFFTAASTTGIYFGELFIQLSIENNSFIHEEDKCMSRQVEVC